MSTHPSVTALRGFLFERLDEDLHRPGASVEETTALRRTLEASRHPLTLQILAFPYRRHPDYPQADQGVRSR